MTQADGGTPDGVDLGIDGLGPAVHLGAGGSANVFVASNLQTGEHIAVKLLRASAATDKERTRFLREQQTLERLGDDTGVVPILSSGVTDRNEPYFLMPLMAGSLQDRIENEGGMEWETAAELMADVADSVENAHGKGVLHRDLKPGNILVDDDGIPRVADFGIAKLLDANVSKSSKSLGTPSFMAPERFSGEEATEQSDVYGLGATLAALVTGTPPFVTGANDTDAAVMMRVVTEAPPTLDNSDAPAELSALITQSMAKDPSERPASAAEFAERLKALLPERAQESAAPLTIAVPKRHITVPIAPKPVQEEERNKKAAWIPAAIAAAVAFAVVVVGALIISGGGDDGDAVATGADAPAETAEANNDADEALSSDDDSGEEEAAAVDDDAADDDEDDSDTVQAEVAGASLSDESDDTAEQGSAEFESDDLAVSGDAIPLDEPTPTTAQATQGAANTPATVADAQTTPTVTEPEEEETPRATVAEPEPEEEEEETPRVTAAPETVAPAATTPETDPPETVPVVPAPSACFSASNSTPEVSTSVRFSSCSSGSSLSYRWEFGDGATSTSSSPSHTYTRTGSFTVRLTVTNDGGTNSTTRTVTVQAAPVPAPSACFSASNSTPEVSTSVRFSSCSSGSSLSYRWEFGDGATSTSSSPSHTYTRTGSFTVRLTVTNDGGTNSTTRTVTVQAAPEPEPVEPPPAPNNHGCSFIDMTNVRWAWSPLPSLVDSYQIEFSNGSRSGLLGEQTGTFDSTNGTVRRIIAIRDGVEAATTVGNCENHGGTKPSAGLPGLAQNVRCRFHDTIRNESGQITTWSETWTWSSGGDTDSYIMEINQDGAIIQVNNGASTTHTTVGVMGASNTGRSVKGIISVGPGGQNKLSITNCGAAGGTGWGS